MIITLKDGSKKEYAQPMSAYDIARDLSEGLARVACIAEIDKTVRIYAGLKTLLVESCTHCPMPQFRAVLKETILK